MGSIERKREETRRRNEKLAEIMREYLEKKSARDDKMYGAIKQKRSQSE